MGCVVPTASVTSAPRSKVTTTGTSFTMSQGPSSRSSSNQPQTAWRPASSHSAYASLRFPRVEVTRPRGPVPDSLQLGHAEAALDLFFVVCEGVQHPHQKAIIHRDLKPSNVLLATTDEKPSPKIIDLGSPRPPGNAGPRSTRWRHALNLKSAPRAEPCAAGETSPARGPPSAVTGLKLGWARRVCCTLCATRIPALSWVRVAME